MDVELLQANQNQSIIIEAPSRYLGVDYTSTLGEVYQVVNNIMPIHQNMSN